MSDDVTFYAMQVWGNRPGREFWDIAFWERKAGDEKGVASFMDATPRLKWMENKSFKDVWAYLVERRKAGALEFSMIEQNRTLMGDLLIRPPHRPDRFPQPSAPLRTQRGSSR